MMGYRPMIVFITGATGFIGRKVVKRLVAAGHELRALCRRPDPDVEMNWIPGDLERPESYRFALEGVDAIIHLGALTGKALATRHDRVNHAATRALYNAARRTHIRRFLFASTIAVRYPEKANHPHAQAKEAAERALRDGQPTTVVVRPTLVLGAESPIGTQLAQLARLPLTPIFGNGLTRIQPVHVDDVADAFVDLTLTPNITRATIELGGPEALTLDELMRRFRTAAGLRPRPIAHLPMALSTSLLTRLEPLFFSVLPVTAEQLYAFRYDSTAEESPFMQERRSKLKTVDEMVRDTLAT